MTGRPMDFGVFLTPFHPTGQSVTNALEYDLERTVRLDRLGYDEVWYGEHHSGGYELIACPEVFIATAAERTKNIRFGKDKGRLKAKSGKPGGGKSGASRGKPGNKGKKRR